jgi:hypothetical protein
MSVDSADYQVKEFIQDLFQKHHCSRKEILARILKFFRAYDASRDLTILILKKQYNNKKKEN